MPVARSGILWRRLSVVLLIAATILYVRGAGREFPHGGSPLGLFFGISAALLIVILAFFGIRKRSYRSTFGTTEQWLQSHVYLGVLVLVLLLYHSGGRFRDHVAVTALLLLAVVVGSGIFGAVLYSTVPRLLSAAESDLTVDEISDEINQLARQMARIATGKSAEFQRIYADLLESSRPPSLAGWRLLFLRRRTRPARDSWAGLLGGIARHEESALRQMLIVSRQRSELLMRLVRQQRYRNILEAWLYVHVPFTIALLIFATVHVVAVCYFGSFG